MVGKWWSGVEYNADGKGEERCEVSWASGAGPGLGGGRALPITTSSSPASQTECLFR